MEIKTYRASSMQEAIALVRRELGPDAAILHTRQAPSGLLGWLGNRQLEVTASNDLPVPSRYEQAPPKGPAPAGSIRAADTMDFRETYREALKQKESSVPSMIESLSSRSREGNDTASVHEAYRVLIEGGFTLAAANELLAAARQRAS